MSAPVPQKSLPHSPLLLGLSPATRGQEGAAVWQCSSQSSPSVPVPSQLSPKVKGKKPDRREGCRRRKDFRKPAWKRFLDTLQRLLIPRTVPALDLNKVGEDNTCLEPWGPQGEVQVVTTGYRQSPRAQTLVVSCKKQEEQLETLKSDKQLPQ